MLKWENVKFNWVINNNCNLLYIKAKYLKKAVLVEDNKQQHKSL